MEETASQTAEQEKQKDRLKERPQEIKNKKKKVQKVHFDFGLNDVKELWQRDGESLGGYSFVVFGALFFMTAKPAFSFLSQLGRSWSQWFSRNATNEMKYIFLMSLPSSSSAGY